MRKLAIISFSVELSFLALPTRVSYVTVSSVEFNSSGTSKALDGPEWKGSTDLRHHHPAETQTVRRVLEEVYQEQGAI